MEVFSDNKRTSLLMRITTSFKAEAPTKRFRKISTKKMDENSDLNNDIFMAHLASKICTIRVENEDEERPPANTFFYSKN
jgi:hypothetical protein